MAQWYDENGIFHNTDNLEYGNQGDTRYWSGTPGAVGSVSYDRPRDEPGAQALFVVTNPAVPSITAAAPDVAAASTAAAQALQRAQEAAAQAARAATAEAQAAAQRAQQAAEEAMRQAAAAAAQQAAAQAGQTVTFVGDVVKRIGDLFGEAQAQAAMELQRAALSADQMRQQNVIEALRLQAEAEAATKQVQEAARRAAAGVADAAGIATKQMQEAIAAGMGGAGRTGSMGFSGTGAGTATQPAATGVLGWAERNPLLALGAAGVLAIVLFGGGRRR